MSTVCSAIGATLNKAKYNYQQSCSIPRRDCDLVDGGWLCSSEKIGEFAPALTTTALTSTITPELSFLAGLSLVEQWNELGLAAVRDGPAKPTITAHQLFMLSAAMYDAYAIYDDKAAPYAMDLSMRQPASKRTNANVNEAISQAAFQILKRLFPKFEDENGYFLQQLKTLGYRPVFTDNQSPSGIGLAAALAVLAERSDDGSNYQNAYADFVSLTYPELYEPFNKPGSISQLNDFGQSFDPNRWQPLRVPNGTVMDGLSLPVIDELNLDSFGDQKFLTPHWGGVTPVALSFGAELRPIAPPMHGSDKPYIDAIGVKSSNHQAYLRQVAEVVAFSAELTDKHKVIAEFWADGPRTESPPGHWNQLAHGIIGRDHLSTDASVKLFFTLNSALLDASIATWEVKRHYDYIRPASAIRYLFDGKQIKAWGGPNQGTQLISGEAWSPYQSLTFVTPPFPEYVSGHSTFSRASAEVLSLFTGSDRFYDGVTQTSQDVNGDGKLDFLGEYIAPAGSFFIEEGPVQDVVLSWSTFREAADEAGLSRLYGGIHIQDGDLRGRKLGAIVGQRAFAKAQKYFNGTINK
ncbi:MAG: vanadium-dependent haloperoxidase [Granulosicoccaceae bacterium]